LPLWAGIPGPDQLSDLVARTIFAPERFGGAYGLPACVPTASAPGRLPSEDPVCQSVHLPWNALVGEGLLAYGLRAEAAALVERLMSAVVRNLKQQRAFATAYHAGTGAGLGERNALHGLAPLGLFLDTLGVRIETSRRLVLSGKNPFPWPVTVKYRGLTVTRRAEGTTVVFPDGQSLTLNDPTEAVVSIE
jgi:hypothetical protein